MKILLTLILISFSTCAYADIAGGLVAWWRFDEAASGTCSGASVLDSSGNNNTGTCGSSPTWVAGKIGLGAMNFNGTSNNIQITNSSSLNPSLITISAWINTSSSGVQQICNKDNAGSGRVWQFRTSSSVVEFIPFNTSSNGDYSGSINIANSAWHLVVGTWDGSTILVYVDGVKDGAGQSFSGTLRTGQANNVEIGSFNVSSDIFNGSIDDVRIYNRALSASDIMQLYSLGFPHTRQLNHAYLSNFKTN